MNALALCPWLLLVAAAPGEAGAALWSEDFRAFQPIGAFTGTEADRSAWVATAGLHAVARPGGGIECSERSAGGWSHLTGRRPYGPAYRFLQVHYAAMAPGAGYRFFAVGLLDPKGKAAGRPAISTVRPGIYTVDSHYVSAVFRDGGADECLVQFTVYGPRQGEGGKITPGSTHTIGWVRLAKEPVNGLAVTMADGSPLGDAVRKGDRLRFRVVLERRAHDVSVEVLVDRSYQPLRINGQPYVQLRKAEGKAGRVWAAQVTVGEGTGTFDATRKPVLFQAIVADGRIWRTYASAFVSFE